MLLRRTFPFPGAVSSGGALAAAVYFDPLQKYNLLQSGYSLMTQTANPSGGTPPYTHAWARQSGSTNIDGGGGSAITTEFGAAGQGGPSTTVTAVWRYTVTDSLAATDYVDFTVNFYFGIAEP